MTPRERVLAALEHREPDRVPIDFGGHRSSGIAAAAYAKLRAALGLPPKPVRVYDPLQLLAIIDDDVLARFGVDTIELGRGFAMEESCWVDWTLPDGTPCQMPAWARPERQPQQWVLRSRSGRVSARMPDGVAYFEQCHWPYRDADDLDRLPQAMAENAWCAVQTPPGPLAAGPAGRESLAAGARRLRERTDRAILGLFGGGLLEIGQSLYRHDNFLTLLAANPQRAHAFLDRLLEIHLADLEQFLGAVGPYIDIIVFTDDLGMQGGPQISRAMYGEFFQPRHARMWRRAKELAPVKVMLHSCGGIRPLLPELIEAGLDAINPVQVSCCGMDARGLKADFGDRLTFWGGGDSGWHAPDRGEGHGGAARHAHHFVLGVPPDVRQVRRRVQELVAILKPGGGFVFQHIHNILVDMPPENIVAMFDAVSGEANRSRGSRP